MKKIGLMISCLLVVLTSFGMEDKDQKVSDFESYADSWEKVQQFEYVGQPASALAEVELILTHSKKEDDVDQMIKALLHKYKYQLILEEEAEWKIIESMTEEIEQSDNASVVAILRSFLAETYWSYFNSRRYEILDRTAIADHHREDFRFWDAPMFFEQIRGLYFASVSDAQHLQSVPIDEHVELLIQVEHSNKYRATLYDLLAHRAIDFLVSGEGELSQPVEVFKLNDAQYFGPADEFVEMKIEGPASFQKDVLLLFQEVLRFRWAQKEEQMTAFLDADLKRIEYLRNNSQLGQKEELFMAGLERLVRSAPDNDYTSYLIYKKANYLYQRSHANTEVPDRIDRAALVALCTNAIELYPKSFGAENCRALLGQLNSKELRLVTERTLPVETSSRFQVAYRNIDKVWFRVYALEADELRSDRNRHVDQEEWVDYLLRKDPVLSWTEDLIDPKDHYDHSTEVLMEGLDKGHYVLIATYDERFKSDLRIVEPILISQLSYVTRVDHKGRLEVYVRDRSTGLPIKGAKVLPYQYEYNYQSRKQKRIDLEPLVTDDHGYVRITKPNTSRYMQIALEISYKEDFLDTGREQYLNTPSTPTENWNNKTFIFTDRSIYRPGQTVYFKAILTSTNGAESKLLPNTRIEIVLRDVNYKEVEKLTLTSNEFGSVHGSFTAPTAGLNGRMQIVTNGGQQAIQVEEYKRPSFEVQLDTLSESFSLGDIVRITGNAKSYAGAPLTEGTVRYRIVRATRYPWWGWWRSHRMPSNSPSKEIAHGEIQLRGDGSFEITYTAEPDKTVDEANDPSFTFTVYVDVVDASGETISSKKSMTLAYKGLRIAMDHPSDWNRDRSQEVAIDVLNNDGKVMESIVEVKLYRFTDELSLKRERLWNAPDLPIYPLDELREILPDDAHVETPLTERPKELVAQYEVNTGDIDHLAIGKEDLLVSGEYWIEASTYDKAGNRIEASSYFTAFSSKDESPIKPVFLEVSTSAKSFEPGTIALLQVSTSLENAHLILKISHNGQILETKYLNLSDEIANIPIQVAEEHRGGIKIHTSLVFNNRHYTKDLHLDVPYASHELDVEWTSFRDVLSPAEQEEWRLTIKGPKGEAVSAELLATMYDKSLDYFLPHGLQFNPTMHPYVRNSSGFEVMGNFGTSRAWIWNVKRQSSYHQVTQPGYSRLNNFGLALNRYGYARGPMMAEMAMDEVVVSAMSVKGNGKKTAKASAGSGDEVFGFAEGMDATDDVEEEMLDAPGSDGGRADDSYISVRENLNESAFFYPQIKTNQDGEYVIAFTSPKALTTWKFLGLAHDQALNHKIFTKELKTQKEIMVTPIVPRFFREGDRIYVSAKVDNLTDTEQAAKIEIHLTDELTNKAITGRMIEGNVHSISIMPNSSRTVDWEIWVGEDYHAISYEIHAITQDHTDAIRGFVPVLSNRILVTETQPLWINTKGEREFTFEALANIESTSLKHHGYTLEYTSNPAWYAVQSLPYLMEFPYECAEQLFSRYYANTLAAHIANSNPRIKQVFDQWRSLDADALLSNLEKNQELKSLLIEETPWLRDAEDETARKKRIALLFDLNKMASERAIVLQKLKELQTSNGGFMWFPGMRDNRYITQHILTGLAHLQQLGVTHGEEADMIDDMVAKALVYTDDRIKEDFLDIKKHDKNYKKNDHLSSIHIQYLYVRSHFRDYLIRDEHRTAFDYFKDQASTFWLKRSKYDQAMISIALHQLFEREVAKQIIVSIKEHSILSEEMGMYWKSIESGGHYWYNAPIEAQAMLIEAFHTVADDAAAVNAMKTWLLKQKQVQDWRTTKATAEAVFALLLRGQDLLTEGQTVQIFIGGKAVDPADGTDAIEAGTGYFKMQWESGEITKDMADIKVISVKDAPSWGAVYWQYFEDLNKIVSNEGNAIQIRKELYVEQHTDAGPRMTLVDEQHPISQGDKVKVRIELKVDRNMEFVHMKDLRAAGFEPVNVLSGYRYQAGLGYYQSTKDAATHFFFDNLNKGVYVFEYTLRAVHKGSFSNGITSIQSMYAPEFGAHSEGLQVSIQ